MAISIDSAVVGQPSGTTTLLLSQIFVLPSEPSSLYTVLPLTTIRGPLSQSEPNPPALALETHVLFTKRSELPLPQQLDTHA